MTIFTVIRLSFSILKKDVCIVIHSSNICYNGAIVMTIFFLWITKSNMMPFTTFKTFNFQRTIFDEMRDCLTHKTLFTCLHNNFLNQMSKKMQEFYLLCGFLQNKHEIDNFFWWLNKVELATGALKDSSCLFSPCFNGLFSSFNFHFQCIKNDFYAPSISKIKFRNND